MASPTWEDTEEVSSAVAAPTWDDTEDLAPSWNETAGIEEEIPSTPKDRSFAGAIKQGIDAPLEAIGTTAEVLGLPSVGKAIKGLTDAPVNYESAGARVSDPQPGDVTVGGFGVGSIPRAITEQLGQVAGSIISRAVGALAGRAIGSAVGGTGGAPSGPGALLTAATGGAVGSRVGSFLGPFAFGAMQIAGPTAMERARNNGRTEPNKEDLAYALTTAASSGALDALGTRYLPGGDKAVGSWVGKITKAFAAEAPLETAQSLTEQTGASLGTKAGLQVNVKQAVAEGAIGGFAGAGITAVTSRSDVVKQEAKETVAKVNETIADVAASEPPPLVPAAPQQPTAIVEQAPAPTPPPASSRPAAADVTFTELPSSVVEIPEGAISVSKAKIGTGTGTVVEYPDRIELKDLVSLKQGEGSGTAIIEALKSKGKPIELVAGRRATDTPIEQLTRFYENRGFRKVEGLPGKFRWEPEQSETTETLTTKDGRKYRLAVEELPSYRGTGKPEQAVQVRALDESGNEIGYVTAKIEGDGAVITKMANVEKKWQRQGVYSELVNKLEAMGYTVTPDAAQSDDAKAFWANRRATRSESTAIGQKSKGVPDLKKPDDSILAIARKESDGLDDSLYRNLESDSRGVVIGAPDSLDRMAQNNPDKFRKLYDSFSETRDALRAKYGNKITLYRAQGEGSESKLAEWADAPKATINYASRKNAVRFLEGGRRKLVKREVLIDDIVAVFNPSESEGLEGRVKLKGNYEEFKVLIPGFDRSILSISPTTSRGQTAPTESPRSTATPATEVSPEVPQSADTEKLSAAQLKERIDILLSRHQSADNETKRKIWNEVRELDRQYVEATGESMGPGAASAEEFIAMRTTGLKKAVVADERIQRGLDDLPPAERQSEEARVQAAEDRVDQNSTLAPSLVKRIVDDGDKAIDPDDAAVLLVERTRLMNERQQWEERVSNGEDVEIGKVKLQEIENQLNRLDQAQRLAGSTWGRVGHLYQRMMRADYSLEAMESRWRGAKQDTLSEKERAEVKELAETVKRTDEGLAQIETTRDQEAAEAQADQAIKQLKKDVAETEGHDPLVASIAERIYQRLKKAADEAHVSLRRRLGNLYANPFDIGIAKDVAIIAAEWIARGIRSFSKFRSGMIEEYGDKVDPYLENAWKEANTMIDQAVERTAVPKEKKAKVKGAVKKLDPGQVREKTVERMKEKFDETSELGELRPYVQNIALSFVRDGITEREPLVDAVHTMVTEVAPDVTRRQTMDLISGYGDFAPLDMETAKVQLREIKGELQQAAKLEDIKAKKPLQMTGVEHRKKGANERRMEKEVNEAKRKYGVVVTDPARQLKSALDSIHTRLKHQIEDITNTIETGRKPPNMTKVEYDAAADRLVAVRDRLRKTLEDLEGKPEITDEQRLKVAERSVQSSIQETERRIKEKDFGPQVKPDGVKMFGPYQVLDALKARREALRAELEELRALDTSLQEEKAFDSLMKQGDDIAAKLKAGDVSPKRPGAKPADTDLVAQARARLDDLRTQLAEARKATPEARQAKIDAAVKAVERSIASYDQRIKTGAIDPATKKPSVSTPELQRLKAERDAMRQYVTELRNAAKPKLSPDEIALKALKTRLLRSNADLKERMAKGDFAPKPVRKIDISKDPEAVKLKAENERAKAEFNRRKLLFERENRTAMQKLMARAAETLNLPRAILSSMDVSAVLRQGGFLSFGNPVRAARNVKQMFKAMASKKAFEESQAELSLRTNADNYRSSGLFLAETGDVRLSAKEEAIMSELADRIPGVRASNRAYVTYLNRMRADSFDAMVGSLTRSGTPTLAEMKAIANFINISTGRGNLGTHAQAAQTLATIFFSPRLLASRFQLLAGIGSGFRFGGGSMRTRALIAKEYAKSLSGLGVILALGALAGASIEKDPRSSDFGKVKFGNTRIDFLMGLSQVSVLLGRLSTGEKTTQSGKIVPIRGDKVPYGSSTGADVTFNFLRSKLSPVLGTSLDLVSGKNVVGETVTPGSASKRLLVPLSFQDIFKNMKENGVPAGTALTLLSMFGAGVQVYDDKK